MLTPLLLLSLLAAKTESETDKDKPEARVSAQSLPVRTQPSTKAAIRGHVAAGEPFWVLGPAEGTRCTAGWAQVEAGGYLCLDGTEPTEDKPRSQPPLIEFDPPDPEEYEQYIASGQYDYQDKVEIVPAIYGRKWKRFQGRLWASAEAYARGDEPVGEMTGKTGEKLGFLRLEDTKRGPVLVRDDGQVAALDEVYLYPVSRLQGRDLEKDPGPEGTLPAITVAYSGAKIRTEWSKDAPVVEVLPFHTWLWVSETPDPTGHWWAVRDGRKVIGWLDDLTGLRHPVPSPGRPEGVGPDELWVDVALEQQALTVWRGDKMVYFTVIASGVEDHDTPGGSYRVLAKHALADMQSRPGADDWYRVEDVPWTIAFKSRYALHGAYWHWGFGWPASHGCVNLAPRDAAWLFANLAPAVPAGWRSISSTAGEGTVIRIRPVPEETVAAE
jgi:hypothetical protein